jgi:hypothetical protein
MKDRKFTSVDKDGQEILLVMRIPTQSQIAGADFCFKKHFSEAVRNGIVTGAEITKLLKEQNIWTEDHDKQATDLRTQIAECENKFLNKEVTKDDGVALHVILKDLRHKQNMLTSVVSAMTDNTAESYASDAKTRYLATECSQCQDGNRKVFKDVKAFNERFPDRLTIDCYRKAMLASIESQTGITLPDSIDAELPEDAWMTEQADKLIKETGPPEAVQVEPKKRGRKKLAP